LEVEVELLSKFSHKNIVKYYGSARTKDTLNIFLEYISGILEKESSSLS